MPLIILAPYSVTMTASYQMHQFSTVNINSYNTVFLDGVFYRMAAGIAYRSEDVSQGFTQMNSVAIAPTTYHLARNPTTNRLFTCPMTDPNSNSNKFAYSDDNGATWVNRSALVSMRWIYGGCAANKDGVVIVTCAYASGTTVGRTLRSLDNGITFTNITANTGMIGMSFLMYIERLGMFLGAHQSVICYSTDNGETWTRQSLGAPQFDDIIDTGTELISHDNVATNAFRRSTDGINWTTEPYNVGESATVRSIASIGGEYFVVHNTKKVYVSSDFVNWVPGEVPFNAYTVVAGNNQLVIGNSGNVSLVRKF